MNTPVDALNDLGAIFGFGLGGAQRKLQRQQTDVAASELAQEQQRRDLVYQHYFADPTSIPEVQAANQGAQQLRAGDQQYHQQEELFPEVLGQQKAATRQAGTQADVGAYTFDRAKEVNKAGFGGNPNVSRDVGQANLADTAAIFGQGQAEKKVQNKEKAAKYLGEKGVGASIAAMQGGGAPAEMFMGDEATATGLTAEQLAQQKSQADATLKGAETRGLGELLPYMYNDPASTAQVIQELKKRYGVKGDAAATGGSPMAKWVQDQRAKQGASAPGETMGRTPPVEEKPGFLSRVGTAVKKGASKSVEEKVKGSPLGTARSLGSAAGAVYDNVPFMQLMQQLIQQGAESTSKKALDKFLNNKGAQ